MIAYYAAQKALHGLSCATDIELLSKCIRVLTYCAEKDILAGKFRNTLSDHLRTLREDKSGSTVAYVPMADVLFTLHQGTTNLHHAARDLLCLIHSPFRGLQNLHAQATLSNRTETTMGSHLEWEWELNNLDSACGDASNNKERPSRLLHAQPQGGAWSTWTPPAQLGALP